MKWIGSTQQIWNEVRIQGIGGLIVDHRITLNGNQFNQFYTTNDGNPIYQLGSSSTECLQIKAVYESGAQGLDQVRFTTKTAGSSAGDGLLAFYVDEVETFHITDNGINLIASKNLAIGGVNILTDSSGTTTLNNIDALDATTIATFETAMESNLDTLNSVTSMTGLTTIGSAGATTNFAAGDVTIYNAVNDGNPQFRIGSAVTESGFMKAVYDSGAQTLDYLEIGTATADSGANAGSIQFKVDGSTTTIIDDGGINFNAGYGISIDGTDILTDVEGTATLSNIDALDATTESTIEAAIDTLTGPIEIEQGASGGGAALLIDNDDVDQIALDIDAANTTGNIIDINAQALTTGKAIYVDCNNMAHASIGVHYDFDESSTGNVQNTLQQINYDRTGNLTTGVNNTTTGFKLAMNDLATGNHEYATSRLTGIDIDLDHANADGFHYQTGIDITLTDADVSHATVTSIGLLSTVENGGFDIKMQSSADTGDFGVMYTGANGATTIETVDDDAAAAHFEVAADGDITLDANGDIKLEPKSGGSILLDGTIDVDAGVVTGATSITSTAFVGALTGQADTVATIAGLAPNTATTQATQGNITSCANLATVGTIGTGVWQGTAVASGYTKHVLHYPFRGYCEGIASGNFQYPEDQGDPHFPFQLNSDYGDTVIADGSLSDVSTWFRSSGVVMPRACTAIDMVGWGTCPGTGEVTISLCKITPDRNSTSAEVPVVVATTTFTALNSNDKLEDFSVGDSGGDGSVTIVTSAIAKGDILMPFVIAPNTKTAYFNFTLEVEG